MKDKYIVFQVKTSENFKSEFREYAIDKGYGVRGMSECARDLIRKAIAEHKLSKLKLKEGKQ